MAGRGIVRVGDMSLGACGHNPMPCSCSNASTVLVNGRPPVVASSFWGVHCNGETCHAEIAISGNPTVLICGLPVITQGSSLSSGDIAGIGSGNVFA